MAGQVIDVTLRLIDQMTSPLNSLGASLSNSAKQWYNAGKSIQKAGKNITNVGKSMTQALTVPIATLGTSAVKLAANFEAGMSKVKSISGEVDAESKAFTELKASAEAMGLSFEESTDATTTAMNILSAQAKKMGAQTKFSATEATEAYSYMAMAGWKAGDMLEGIGGIMQLAGATGEELASVSDIVTDGLTAFGMSAKDTTQFVDVLAATSSNANTNVAMLGESFSYVAPVAGSLGYSVQDVSLALGVMANSGIKASSAGTALRSLMTNLSKPTDSMAVAMKKLGISMTDSSGQMKPFDTLMREMRSSFSGLSESQKAQYAATLAGKTGMSGLLAIINASDSDFNKLSEAINGSTNACRDMYDVANDNLSGQLTILKSTAESIGIAFGEKMLPCIKDAAIFAQNLADKINNLNGKQVETIIKIAGVVAAIGPALMVFGKIVTFVGKITVLVAKVGFAIQKAGSVGAMVLGAITSPAAIVIGVLAAIAAATVIVVKNWDKIKAAAANVKKWLVDSFGGAGGAFEKFKTAFEIVKNTVLGVVDTIKKAIESRMPAITGTIDKAKGALATVGNFLGNVFKTKVNIVADVVLKLAQGFRVAVRIIGQFLKNVVSSAAPGFAQLGSAIKAVAENRMGKFKKAWNVIVPVIRAAIPIVKDIAKTIAEKLGVCVKAMYPVVLKLGTTIGTVFSSIVKFAGNLIAKVSPIFDAIKAKLASHLPTVKQVQRAFVVVFKNISEVMKGFLNTVTTIFSNAMGIFNGVLDFITGVFTGNWKKAWEGVKSVFKGVFDTFATIAKAPINEVINIINKAISSLNKISVNIPDWVPEIGGKSFNMNISPIPQLAKGTNNWQGGLVQVHERGGEIIDLPQGSRVYPHDKSVSMAYNAGQKASGGVSINIPKLAEQIVVRENADIDAIVNKLADKLEKVAQNIGGGEIGYSY